MSTRRSFSSHLAPVFARYLALKQALGRQYAVERDVLAHLDRFLAAQPVARSDLTPETFTQWCATLAHLTPGVRRKRMRIVRNLCLYRQRTEPGCFVPDPNLFPRPHAPLRPHFFTEQEFIQLLDVTEGLQPTSNSPLRAEVYRLALVLLYTAGLRRGELVRLILADYEPRERTLHIRATKFHKSRLVPLSRDGAREMDLYLKARRSLPHTPDTPLLCNRNGGLRPYTGAGLGQGLRHLFRCTGVRTFSGQPPRVHDMRHSFAHNALLRWYRAGVDVQTKLPSLATYMGHVSIISTQHYLTFMEPVAQSASDLFAHHCASLLDGARHKEAHDEDRLS